MPVQLLQDDTPTAAQHPRIAPMSSTAPDLQIRGGANPTALQSAAAPEASALQGVHRALDTFQPAALQGSIQDAITSIRNVQQSTSSLSVEIQSAMEQLKGWTAPGTPAHRRAQRAAARQRAKAGRRPYSQFLAEPFIKVPAWVQVRCILTTVSRMPLLSKLFLHTGCKKMYNHMPAPLNNAP